jgi:hypothetical protein
MKLFVADENHEAVITRSRAKGHKRLVIDNNVEIVKPIELKTDGTDLVASRTEETDDNEVYTILTKEFGLVSGATGLENDISVILCDDGYMLVTLYKGAIAINIGGQLMMPVAGDVKAPSVVESDILWIDADRILEYGKYFGTKGNFMFDFEWRLLLRGDRVNGLTNFHLQHLADKDIDLSLGYFAQYEQNIQLKEQAKEAKNLVRDILQTGSGTSYEFDDDDFDYEDDEEDEQEVDELADDYDNF